MTRRNERDRDPMDVLGLPADATKQQVEDARRTLAKLAHPDVGGSHAEMQRVNTAADAAIRRLEASTNDAGGAQPPDPRTPPARSSRPGPAVQHDHPSFTIEALPAEAYEAMLLVAAVLGDLIDDEPPYRLEVALAPPIAGWCRADLMPEAGASSVSLAVAGEPGRAAPDLDDVRDAWIAELNRLDWSDLDGFQPQP